ncbi:hypothetical protein RRG08_028417 [Elysia crispata]|uniref:Uncharacterized protein n=1 Tax=Elysia crispata TaxID=231223 RepID=A0AAE1A3I3_9GAST|nr:hypothetical protein RRG08_028417 [Elysia crispata]
MPTRKNTPLTLIYVLTWMMGPRGTSAADGVNSTQRCLVSKAKASCDHYYLISQLKFHAFIDPRSLDTTCRQTQEAMACVNKLLVGCNDITRMPFDMQNSVLKAVCSDRRQEYLDSSRCFSTTSLRERIELRCLSKAANQRRLRTEPCRLTEEIISCADGAVRMTNGCAVRDAQLMASLLFDFLSILCETWKEGLTTTDSMRTVTTSTTLVSLPKVERPSKRIETDKPLRGNGSPSIPLKQPFFWPLPTNIPLKAALCLASTDQHSAQSSTLSGLYRPAFRSKQHFVWPIPTSIPLKVALCLAYTDQHSAQTIFFLASTDQHSAQSSTLSGLYRPAFHFKQHFAWPLPNCIPFKAALCLAYTEQHSAQSSTLPGLYRTAFHFKQHFVWPLPTCMELTAWN